MTLTVMLRIICQNHKFNYNNIMTVAAAETIAEYILLITQEIAHNNSEKIIRIQSYLNLTGIV